VKRAALVFPGRGSYTASSLGSLPREHPLVRHAEELRTTWDLPPLLELDGAASFEPRLHLLPSNASPLIFVISLLDSESLPADARPVVALGNSMGWYTALAATGVLSFDDGFRLVQEISLLQERHQTDQVPGGQVIYPLAGPDWRVDPERADTVRVALAAGNGEVHRSVELGGYTVLAGTETGVARLMEALPPIHVGERTYPLRLALSGPYHTPLVADVAELARARLADLDWHAPNIALIDGRGARWSPWSTDPGALRDYTLGEQITTPFGFATSLRVALREWAPDVLLLPGPGNSLGGICGQALVAEGYRGIRSRADFEATQQREALIISARR
jgi:[acyl-carrier-protein] S-malonyltransferase